MREKLLYYLSKWFNQFINSTKAVAELDYIFSSRITKVVQNELSISGRIHPNFFRVKRPIIIYAWAHCLGSCQTFLFRSTPKIDWCMSFPRSWNASAWQRTGTCLSSPSCQCKQPWWIYPPNWFVLPKPTTTLDEGAQGK